VSDLRIIGRTNEGFHLELQSHDGTSYLLPIDDQLRAVVNTPRLVAVSSSEERSILTVKEVQARLRGGEAIDSISRSSDWSPEKIDKFSGPILQERAYVIGLALASQLRKEKHAPTLGSAAISQLEPRGVEMELVEWNTWRLPDGTWNIVLFYPNKSGDLNEANWTFDLANRNLEAIDDGAAWISGDELESRSHTPSHGIVYPSNTPAPRLVAVRPESENVSDISLEERRDGISKRLKIPSWDDIMFGSAKEPSEEE
jgi:hypothetical protein